MNQKKAIGRCFRKVLSIALNFVQPGKYLFSLFQRIFEDLNEFSDCLHFSPLVKANLSTEVIKIRDQLFGATFSDQERLLLERLVQSDLSQEKETHVRLQRSVSQTESLEKISRLQVENNLNMEHQMGVELYMRIWGCFKKVSRDDWLEWVDIHEVRVVLREVQEVRELSLRLKASISGKPFVSSGKSNWQTAEEKRNCMSP